MNKNRGVKRNCDIVRNKFTKKKLFIGIAFLISITSICVSSSNVFAERYVKWAIANPGSTHNWGCKTGNCADTKIFGAFWIKAESSYVVTTNAKGKKIKRNQTVREILRGDYAKPTSSAKGKIAFDLIGGRNKDTTIPCGKSGYVYMLVTPLLIKGLAGPADSDYVRWQEKNNPDASGILSVDEATEIVNRKYNGKNPYYKGKKNWELPAGAVIMSDKDVEKEFNRIKEHLNSDSNSKTFRGSHLGWFCSKEKDGGTPPPSTSYETPDPPQTAIECSARATREWGDTRTRIAVRNASLDGSSWTAKDERQGLPTDSGWTDEGGTYWTIAKPGDGIQFRHEFCAGDRFVRRTAHKGRNRIYDESHDQIFNITPNKFKIGGTPESYAFGNGIEWTNKIGESIDKYEDLFSAPGKPDGVSLTYNGYGVAVPSPTPSNKDYDCSEYKSDNPYHKGTYQIPGFDSGECNSSKKTGISNPVGSTITQWHDFNRVKAWERYSYKRSGDCSCMQNDAWFGGRSEHKDYVDWSTVPMQEKVNMWWGARNEWQCGPVQPKTCGPVVCVDWDAYGNCLRWEFTESSWSRTENSEWIEYESLERDYGTVRKTAHAYVPYNYSTSISSRILNDDHLLQGTGVNSRFIWKIEPRENDKLSDFDYATVTPKNTQVQMVEFLYHPDNQSVEGKEFSRENPEAFFKSKGAIMTNAQTIASGNQNPRGLYDGKRSSKTITSVVPDNDEWVGYKYCVAVGIFPADSHDDINGENNSLEMQYTYGAGAMDAGSYWNISGATCRTIAKKPSFEVWNGSVYTNNGINTSMSHKIVNAKLGSDINAPKDLFGSWTDYAVIAGKKVDGMSSGAMLGFNNGRYNLSGNKGQSTNTINSEHLSPETIANKNGETGNSNINANTSINMNLERLRSRYSEKARNMAFNETHTNSQPTIISSKTGMQFVYFDGNLKTSELGIRNVANGINQTTSRNRNKDLVKGLGDGKNDNTLVIYVRGNLVIDNNICLGEGCLGNGVQLVDYRFNRKTNSAAKLPQVLIFADNINITENVTRVDAWLVANNTLNTCAGYDPNSVVAKDALNRYSEGVCYKTLMVNGPVYASELILPRTAGATHGYSPIDSSDVLYRRYGATGKSSDSILGSGTPAEIFNLRADAYLWAYNQAQRYSEAIVTYKRELAPRY